MCHLISNTWTKAQNQCALGYMGALSSSLKTQVMIKKSYPIKEILSN